jgi:ribosomal protein L13E
MITIAVNPMKPNPRIWDLLDQAPFLVQVFFVSLTGVLVHLAATTLYGMIISIKEQVDASGLMKQITQEEPEELQGGEVEGDEADPSKVGMPSSLSKELDKVEEEDVADADDEQLDLQQRTAAIQYQLRQIIKNKDILMTNLFVHLQGASLHDPKIVLAMLKHWTTDRDKENIKMLEAQGMPERGRYKEVGLTVEQLAGDLHWTPAMLKEAGFKSADLKEGDNFCAFELKGAYTDAELALGGFSVNDLSEIGIDAEKLKAELTADRLKAIGYTLSDLYAAGFKVEDLKSQYTADQIKEQGYSAGEMRDGGFIAAELTKVEFTAKELKEGGFSAYELYEAGVEAEDMNKAEFKASELKGAGYTISALRRGGYGLDELKEIPVPPADLRAAGYTAGEFKAASYSVEQTKGCGFSLPDMREGGFDPKELKENGYTVTDFKHAGFTAKDLKDAEQNRGRDFPVIELKEAGYTPKEMMEGGYQRLEMKRAGYRLIDIKEFFDVTVETAKESGFTAKEMYVANFDASEMLRNGADGKPNFFETELMAAGYGEDELAPAREVYEFTLWQLVDARNPPSKWGPGVVTSVHPLKVKKGGYFFSREYKHVRPRNPPDAKL